MDGAERRVTGGLRRCSRLMAQNVMVERIAHEILTGTDQHHTNAQIAYVIHCGLQGAVVLAWSAVAR